MRQAGMLLTILLGLALPGVSRGSAEDLFGYGGQSPALAGGGTSVVQGYAAVHSNPAMLNSRRERSLTLGYSASLFSVDIDGERHPIEAVRASVIGVTLPIPLIGLLSERLTIGMGFFVPSRVVVRAKLLYPDEPQFLLYDARAQSVAIQLGFGADLARWLSIGAGFRALAELIGTVRLTADASGRLGSQVEDQLVATYAPIVGALVRQGPLRIGVTVRGELAGRIDVDVITDETPVPLPNLNIAGTAQYDPFTVAAEVAWAPGPEMVVALGCSYKRWSSMDGPMQRTNEAGPAPPNPRARDIVVPHVAGEWRPRVHAAGLTAAIRGGVALEPSPLLAATARARYYDNGRLKLGVGVGLALRRASLPPLRFEVYGQEQVLLARSHDDGAVTDGSILSTGITVGVEF